MLEFKASPGARLGAWALLAFWLLFAAFWTYEWLTGPGGLAVTIWTGVAVVGLALQTLRVRGIAHSLVQIDGTRLTAQDLFGRPIHHELESAASVSILRRRTRATLFLRFDASRGQRRLGRQWICSLDELEAPREFVAELLSRVPQALVDGSVDRYLKNEEASDSPVPGAGLGSVSVPGGQER